MERAETSEFTERNDESPLSSSDGSVTLVQAEEVSREATITTEIKGRNINSSFDVKERYLMQRATVPNQNIFNPSTHSHAVQFLEVMKAYQNSHKDSSIRSLDLSGAHSWDEVMRVVKTTEAAYFEAGRSGLRRAASQISKGREKVVATILRIPDIIMQAEHSVETFYPDPALYEKAEDLYLAILRAIEGAVGWLKQHPLGKQARALARGQQYNKHFKEKVQVLDEALAALQARASVLRDDAIVTTQKMAENVGTVVNKMAITGEVVNSRTRATLRHVQSLQKETKDMRFVAEHNDVQLSSVTTGIKTFTENQDILNVKISDVHTAQQTTIVKIDDLHGVQQETHNKVETLTDVQLAKEQAAKAMEIALETAEWREKDGRDISRLKRQLKRLQKAASGLTQADLLDILSVHAEAPIEDLRRIHRACQSLESSDSQIAQGIFEGAKFREWLAAYDSAALFVEGGPALAFHGRVASLSLMSCLAIECLEGKEPAISIHHFCRRHISSKDPVQGPTGMMRSLICQVLRLFHNQVDLGFMSSRRYREQIESHNLHILCDCFANIVKQLPADTVLFCVVDSINCFERHEWAEDCRFMMREIQDLLHEYDCGPVFKLLVTCPVRSKYVGGTFNSQCRLLLSGDGSGGRNNPTEREMSEGARRPKARESNAFRSLRNMFPAGMEDSSEGSSDSDSSSGSDPE